MLPADRKRQILSLLDRRGSLKVTELRDLFGVTEETVRRDLEQLEQEGHLRRVYGGAISTRSSGYELPFTSRERRNLAEKQRIAQAAVRLIQERDTILLDASTTALQLARILPDNLGLTVITNSIKVAGELALRPGITVISTGGVARANALSLVGPLAERAVADYHADKVLMSCKGLDPRAGVTDSNEAEVELKKRMVAVASRVILLADHTKFGQVALKTVCPVSAVHVLVTDRAPEGDAAAWLQEENVEVVVGE